MASLVLITFRHDSCCCYLKRQSLCSSGTFAHWLRRLSCDSAHFEMVCGGAEELADWKLHIWLDLLDVLDMRHAAGQALGWHGLSPDNVILVSRDRRNPWNAWRAVVFAGNVDLHTSEERKQTQDRIWLAAIVCAMLYNCAQILTCEQLEALTQALEQTCASTCFSDDFCQ